uniref:Myb-like domain-containing protein n=1 Tax=Picocystis salinarum TaxID=88271 RepID=A0A7S3XEI2_9CHLO
MAVALEEVVDVGWLEDPFLQAFAPSGTEEESAHSLVPNFAREPILDADATSSKYFVQGESNFYPSLSRFGDGALAFHEAGMQRYPLPGTNNTSSPSYSGKNSGLEERLYEYPFMTSLRTTQQIMNCNQAQQQVEQNPLMFVDSFTRADENEWANFLSAPVAGQQQPSKPAGPAGMVKEGSTDTLSELTDSQKFRRTRTQWENDEESALLEGVAEYGVGYWKQILQDKRFSKRLWRRRNVDLKDKWRVLNRRGAKKLQSALNKAKHDLKMVRTSELAHWQHTLRSFLLGAPMADNHLFS